MPKIRFQGFTLAELLTALAILGIIATFTIPKVLSAQQNSTKKAVFKETIAAIANVSYVGNQRNTFTASTYRQYLFDNLNLVKICPNNSSTEGCHAAAMQWSMEVLPGGVMHNGSTFSMGSTDSETMGFLVDWNGDAPPNTLGDDQLFIWCPYSNLSYWYANYKLPAYWDDSSVNTALWQTLI